MLEFNMIKDKVYICILHASAARSNQQNAVHGGGLGRRWGRARLKRGEQAKRRAEASNKEAWESATCGGAVGERMERAGIDGSAR
jgi:hypothetical protein